MYVKKRNKADCDGDDAQYRHDVSYRLLSVIPFTAGTAEPIPVR